MISPQYEQMRSLDWRFLLFYQSECPSLRSARFYIHLQSDTLLCQEKQAAHQIRPVPLPCNPTSEVEPNLRRQRSRRDVMCPAERGKEVVERIFVRNVDGCEPQAHLVLVALEYVVMPDRDIEQVSRRDARRILVVVLRVRRRHLQQTRPELRYWARVRQSLRRSRPQRSAEQPRLEFLIGAERNSERIRHGNRRLPRRSHGGLGAVAAVAGSLPGDLPTVIAPVESEPRSGLPGLVLQVCGQIEFLVMIDPEGI